MPVMLFQGPCNSQTTDMPDYNSQREQMVTTQIESRGVRDIAVLEAMEKVARHKFVPKAYQREAYGDYPLSIGSGQTISQPYIVAFMTEALELKKSDRVLEIGTGSGYQAAILAEICDSVYTIEIIGSLGEKAKQVLSKLGYKNIFVRIADGYKGWPEAAPFDAIIVTCSPSAIPEPLEEQLAEGGRMIIPVGRQFSQSLVLLTKQDGRLKKSHVLPVRFVPMVDEGGTVY